MKKNKNYQSQHIVSIMDSDDFQLVESYKALRTNLMFSLPAKENTHCRKILFTSATPGDGKTTTTVNLALTLAETETRVLLIDADMRKPTVNKYFSVDTRLGLSNLLSGMNKRSECIQSIPDIPNLSVIPSGVLPPNPSELLGSAAMDKLLADLDEYFDYIIIDTPPVNVVTDALAIAGKVDGVALVVAQRKTTMPEIESAIEALRFANANILGIVMNRVMYNKHSTRFSKRSYGSYNYSYHYQRPTNSGTPDTKK